MQRERRVARGGVEPPTSHFSGERSFQLSYLAELLLQSSGERPQEQQATPTGLEPATSAVTGQRSNQLSYGAIALLKKQLMKHCLDKILPTQQSSLTRDPSGIRTRAAAVKGRSPRPLDDGA